MSSIVCSYTIRLMRRISALAHQYYSSINHCYSLLLLYMYMYHSWLLACPVSLQSEKSRHILHLRQRLHDLEKMIEDGHSLPKYCELTLSDEEKTELTEKCVQLLLRGRNVCNIE